MIKCSFRSARIGALLSAAAAGAALVAVPAAAQPAPAQPAERGQWQVDGGELYCSLIRRAGGNTGKEFALRAVPGTTALDLITMDSARVPNAPEAGEEVTIVLRPSGDRISGALLQAFPTATGGSGFAIGSSEDFVDRFAASTGIDVVAEGRTQFTMDFPRAGNAVGALRNCEELALRQWGLDPASITSLRSPPRPVRRESVVTPEDYPQSALRARQSGIVLLRLVIDPAGRVADCDIGVSSGVPALDNRSCDVMRERGRFHPAVGPDGQPAQGVIVTQVTWTVPTELRPPA